MSCLVGCCGAGMKRGFVVGDIGQAGSNGFGC